MEGLDQMLPGSLSVFWKILQFSQLCWQSLQLTLMRLSQVILHLDAFANTITFLSSAPISYYELKPSILYSGHCSRPWSTQVNKTL